MATDVVVVQRHRRPPPMGISVLLELEETARAHLRAWWGYVLEAREERDPDYAALFRNLGSEHWRMVRHLIQVRRDARYSHA